MVLACSASFKSFVLWVDFRFIVPEQNGDFTHDVVVTELAEALVERSNGRFIGGGLLLLGLNLLLLLLNFLLVGLDLLLVLLNLLLGGSQAGLNVLRGLQIRGREKNLVCDDLVFVVTGTLDFHRQAGDQRGHAQVFLAKDAFRLQHLSAGGQDDRDVLTILRLNGHGGAASPVNDALDLITLRGDKATNQKK
jgi:hypothetical protein